MQQISEIPKLATRAADAHKGSFGKICIVGGSVGFSGAMAIAGRSALRSGAGLVRVATPESVLGIIAAIEPCYTTIPLPADADGRMSSEAVNVVLDQVEDNDVMAFGPGAGIGSGVKDVINALIGQGRLRLVVDADGLNCLARAGDWPGRRKASMILTPHPGEMKRLWAGLFREPLPPSRIEQAGALAEKTGCVVVLKGAGTVVTDAERVYVNTTGNPGMATAGSGDVLTGVIAAMVAQGLNDFDATVLGVYVHGLAGDIAAKKIGQVSLMATDITDNLGEAFISIG
ncbi:MAG: NAD(P)H-hydrate dehydratase [Planctomycetes bacterium]|nr:NAD(P)H-hydrate dehydratase [Planctomycetota bacterium]